MAIIKRSYQTDADLDKVFTTLNGSIANDNVSNTANIAVSKVASESGSLDLTTSPTVASATYVDVTGATITFTPAGTGSRKVRVAMTVRLSHSSVNTPVMQMVMDGTAILADAATTTMPVGGYEATVPLSAIVTLTAGTSHTLKLQAKVGGGTTTFIVVHIEWHTLGT